MEKNANKLRYDRKTLDTDCLRSGALLNASKTSSNETPLGQGPTNVITKARINMQDR